MTENDEIKRLQLATRLHGATMPVIQMLMTTDGAPTLGELHVICGIAERVERTGHINGVAGPLFTQLLATLMQTTAEVRAYLDRQMQGVIAERAARADPAAVLKALDDIADQPAEPGDDMPDDIAAAIEREVVPPLQHVDLLRDFLGLVGADAALMKSKWQLMRITALAIDEHGIAIDEIAAEIGETPGVLQRWLDYVVRDVSFDRLAAVYHAVAEKAELWPLEWLIGGKPGGDA